MLFSVNTQEHCYFQIILLSGSRTKVKLDDFKFFYYFLCASMFLFFLHVNQGARC